MVAVVGSLSPSTAHTVSVRHPTRVKVTRSESNVGGRVRTRLGDSATNRLTPGRGVLRKAQHRREAGKFEHPGDVALGTDHTEDLAKLGAAALGTDKGA